jgi:molybdenum cofactor cytidylyltransferase
MELFRALRILPGESVAFVGAGGKTSSIFSIARQTRGPVVVTTTTHLFDHQSSMGDGRWPVNTIHDFEVIKKEILRGGVHVLVGGSIWNDRVGGAPPDVLLSLRDFCKENNIPLLIEADGAKMLPVKAPAVHEPAIPTWVDVVVTCTGLSAIGEPLDAVHVHRPEVFSRITSTKLGSTLTIEMLASALNSPDGGLKNIPSGARRIALFNRADNALLQAGVNRVVPSLLDKYDAVVTAKSIGLDEKGFHFLKALSANEKCAGVILAAGKSTRMGVYGGLKQLLEWRGKPFLWHVVQAALQAGLDPVHVVIGAESECIKNAMQSLPVVIIPNADWEQGQGTSVRTGIESLPATIGAAIFLMADQPHIQPTLVRSLVEKHTGTLAPIVAPLIDGQRGNPVLFDRDTFAELKTLQGDTGGRALFSRYPIQWQPWSDSGMLMDIDTPEDYRQFLERNGNDCK